MDLCFWCYLVWHCLQCHVLSWNSEETEFQTDAEYWDVGKTCPYFSSIQIKFERSGLQILYPWLYIPGFSSCILNVIKFIDILKWLMPSIMLKGDTYIKKERTLVGQSYLCRFQYWDVWGQLLYHCWLPIAITEQTSIFQQQRPWWCTGCTLRCWTSLWESSR